MPVYAGEVKITYSNGLYVNFYPGYRIENGNFIYLDDRDIRKLLPDSQYLNINLFTSSPSISLEDLFQDGDDIILEFEQEDLQPNYRSNGQTYPSAWKLDISYDNGACVRHMEDLGYCCLIDEHDVLNDWRENRCVEFEDPNVIEGMKVMIPSGEPNLLIGPLKAIYDVDRQKKDHQTIYYALVSDNGNEHLCDAYTYEDGIRENSIVLEQDDVTRRYVRTMGRGIEKVSIDLIDDETLLEDLRTSLLNDAQNTHSFSKKDIADILETYRRRQKSRKSLSDDILRKRKARLREIFEGSGQSDEREQLVAEFLGPMLVRFPQEPVYHSVLQALSQDDEFLDRTSLLEPFRQIADELERDIDALRNDREELSKQVDELRKLDPKQKIEAARKQLTELDGYKAKAQSQLDEILEKTHLSENLEALLGQKAYLEAQIEDKQKEIQRQEQRLTEIAGQFDDLMARSSQRVLEMNFDSLIGERFMAQAARQEQKKTRERYEQAARALSTLNRTWLDDEQAVNTLVARLCKARPNLTYNEAINMLICLTQSAFTLFSGRPGSGKTSAAKVLAHSLGLEQPAKLELQNPDLPNCSRFISISVEKGWISKRDLVGSYNPLTRSFDPSHQGLYDLLNIMDAEVRFDQDDALPGIVLLDDANLSNMEYYLADFMALDEKAVRGTINPGTGDLLQIPRSLHFIGTVQNDQTCEPISGRLLDRCWVIDMPDHPRRMADLSLAMEDRDGLFSQKRLDALFGSTDGFQDLEEPLEEAIVSLFETFEQSGLPVSYRSRQAIRAYLHSALRWFKAQDDQTNTIQEAFDFAISQRLLAQISGSGQDYRSKLEALLRILEGQALPRSSAKLRDIMERGDHSMQYYQYF